MEEFDRVEVYRRARADLVAVVGAAGVDVERPAPACPGWRVRDVVAHVTGIAADFQDGRLPSGDLPAWTAEQVAWRSDRPFADVLAEWEARAPGFEEAMRGPLAAAAPSFAADAVSHLHDVAGALAVAVGRDSVEVIAALDLFVVLLGRRIEAAGLPPLRIEAAERTWTAGSGPDPGAVLRAHPFEALRALSGRRTAEEIAALDWDGDGDAYGPVIAAYAFPQQPLGE